jgi:hypothetical protein
MPYDRMLADIRHALEEAGLEFIAENGDKGARELLLIWPACSINAVWAGGGRSFRRTISSVSNLDRRLHAACTA